MKIGNWALLRLHKNYKILAIVIVERELSQQYVNLFKVVKKVKTLTYKLVLSEHWRIHSIVFIAHLKFAFESRLDFFHRAQISFLSVFMKEKSKQDNVKFFEIEKIITTRYNRRKDLKFLIHWMKYDLKDHSWRNVSKLVNVMNHMQEFNQRNFTHFAFRFCNRLKINAY